MHNIQGMCEVKKVHMLWVLRSFKTRKCLFTGTINNFLCTLTKEFAVVSNGRKRWLGMLLKIAIIICPVVYMAIFSAVNSDPSSSCNSPILISIATSNS